VAEIENEERVKKISVIPLLIAFAVVTKLYLRAEPVNAELKESMPSSEHSQLKTASNSPLEIT
jgi:putative membrane protein